ncbi:hypothetical protein [Streptomyces sp. CC208A]|uniref:hypothetical protein n=1 Tax=Streptomyces sp. CC208A TaxID=3044573 RepID=UPI0024A86BB7|nr:hypothetical protein [Streptomyces sp. CC208A]
MTEHISPPGWTGGRWFTKRTLRRVALATAALMAVEAAIVLETTGQAVALPSQP